MFFVLRYTMSPQESGPHLSQAQMQKLVHQTLDQARDKLSDELLRVSAQATWLASNSSRPILDDLERSHPGALLGMLRATLTLDAWLNMTKSDWEHDLEVARNASLASQKRRSGPPV